MVTLHEVITFLVSMQISISSLQTHNVNRCGRSRHLARKLSLRRKRSSPNVFEMAATETITSIILIKLIRVSLGTVRHPRRFKIVVIDIQITLKQMLRDFIGIRVNRAKKSGMVNITRQIAINGHIKFNLTIPLQQLNGLETLVIIMVANKYAFLQITRRRFLNEWEAFKKVISRRNIRRCITITLTLSNLKLLRRITRTENILHRNFTRRQVAIQNRVASNIGISQSTFSVKVLNLFSRSRRKTNKRKSKHSAMLRNKETRHRMFIGLLNTTRKLA